MLADGVVWVSFFQHLAWLLWRHWIPVCPPGSQSTSRVSLAARLAGCPLADAVAFGYLLSCCGLIRGA
ncbi:uncharacterized protein LY79DRAFT_568909 [Colletotrichum navitas]|uniref:Uncharacterized protein n=1 Tax=Colletotrichum navitas TaxID=681940 RepID=A0AAD8UY29_9PEZI|nr:uncharacterized protein LY79DRAFT_568909 [Colletotrichum navitas]KAK1573281.1 hypothetical protein LY79DRAFT_568909 [Colletotrichum navitas]